MAMSDAEEFFGDPEMRRRYETVKEFIENDSGWHYGIDEETMCYALCAMRKALNENPANEGIWEAYVVIDVLVDILSEMRGKE